MTDALHDRRSTWIVDLAVKADVMVGDGRPAGRDAFVEWLWETLGEDGLAGVFEGAVDVETAAAAGLVDSPLVLDAAEAPPERDWIAGMECGEVVCWFTDEAAARRAADGLARVAGCDVRGVRSEMTPRSVEAWRDGFGVVAVPGFGSVVPAWEPGHAVADASGAAIYIEPGAGFGTGLHETTQLCLAAISAWRGAGERMDRVLDFGSGSGVLAIAAAVLGAGHVDAVEIDGRVHDAIAANAARNQVAGRVGVMSHVPSSGSGYDLIVANIVAEVLLRHADDMCARLQRDAGGAVVGAVVLSGLLAADVGPVAAAFTKRLGVAPQIAVRGGWHCLRFSARPFPDDGGASCH